VLTASLAFDIIDRIGGGTLGVWFAFNMICMLMLCAAVAAAAAFVRRGTGGLLHLRCEQDVVANKGAV
jgi:hypothetical protein